MRKFFLVVYSIPFIVLSVLLDLMPTISAYDEALRAHPYVLIVFGLYAYIARLLWVGKATTMQYRLVQSAMIFSVVAMLFPGSSALFLHGPSTYHSYGLELIFSIGIVPLFNRASTGEVMFYEVLANLFIHSLFSFIFFYKQRKNI